MLSVLKIICFVLVLVLITALVIHYSNNIPKKTERLNTLQRAQQHSGGPVKLLAKKEARPHSAPYVVSIQKMNQNGKLEHHCGGSIINESWVLTAAHCLEPDYEVEDLVLVAGCHDICDTEDGEKIQPRTIDRYIKHYAYFGGVAPYDIALIRTKTPFNFTKFVKPVKLPDQGDLPHGEATCYGWGNMSMTECPIYPNKLQAFDMPILNFNTCESLWGLDMHETNLCTGPLVGGISICNADSGGPLVQRDSYFDQPTILGVVSWGREPCGQPNAPSVFVKVPSVLSWIKDTINSA